MDAIKEAMIRDDDGLSAKANKPIMHTPGPWLVSRTVSGNGIATHVGTVSAGLVASVGDHDARCGGLAKCFASQLYDDNWTRMAVMEANARLVAAAPSMLETLDIALVDLRRARDSAVANGFDSEAADLQKTVLKVKQAIELATGEPARDRAAR